MKWRRKTSRGQLRWYGYSTSTATKAVCRVSRWYNSVSWNLRVYTSDPHTPEQHTVLGDITEAEAKRFAEAQYLLSK